MTEETETSTAEASVAQFEPARIESIGPSFDTVVAVVTGDIVQSFIDRSSLSARDALDVLPKLVRDVSQAFYNGVDDVEEPAAPATPVEVATPAAIKKSITPDALISFIDGRPYKTLKRHLGTHGLDGASYRARYGLPADYPMVAASYSAARSALAKDIGLGTPRKKPALEGA